MIGKQISRYRILSEIASGGMGAVYLAEDPELQRSIALKVLPADLSRDPAALSRFKREARAIAAVNHPNIVTIHSVEADSSTPFLTMELVEGRTLAEILDRGPVDPPDFFDMAIPLVRALEAAHAQGVTHRDLKPANVMIGDSGSLKVLDFGLAKLLDHEPGRVATDSPTESIQTDRMIIGTPNYMAPEQARGMPADPRSDIFSAGAVFHHMLSGMRPFRGETAAEIIASVLRDDPEPLDRLNRRIPARLARAVTRCLAKSPGDRFPTATLLREELERCARELATQEIQTVRSIAVLPFADLSPQQDQEHFCAGIAEEIINALTRIQGLKVASRMSSFQYRELGGDSREIGARLGVQTLLEGSVRRSGDQMRVMAQLIDVADGYHIWSQRFDREVRDIFDVQDEIATSIVRALQLAIGKDQPAHLVEARTEDPTAYDFYLRGRDFFRRWGKRNIQIAQRMFGQAIALDPGFASAYAGLADTYCYLYMYINATPENLLHAERNSARALDLDPALAEAHAARGLALSLGKSHEAAAKAFHTAIDLDPNLFEAYYFAARDAVVQGKYEEAVDLYDLAAQASPDDYQIPILEAQIHHALGRTEDEERANRRGMDLAEKAILLNPEDARACYMGAGAMIRLGQRERGLKWAKRALALDPDDPAILYNVACNFAGLGMIEEAVDCLERTVKVGAAYRDWINNDTDLDPLRDNLRFQALLRSLA